MCGWGGIGTYEGEGTIGEKNKTDVARKIWGEIGGMYSIRRENRAHEGSSKQHTQNSKRKRGREEEIESREGEWVRERKKGIRRSKSRKGDE